MLIFLGDMFSETIAGQGIVALLMFGAIVWQNKYNQALFLKLEAAHQETLKGKDKQLELVLNQLTSVETRITKCEDDRQKLWAKLVDLSAHMLPIEAMAGQLHPPTKIPPPV